MEKFVWSESCECAVDEINEQHRELFRIAKEIEEIPVSENQDEWIKESVHALFRYMEKHFETEEKILEEVGYPHLAEHRIHHREIVQAMTDLLRHSTSMKQLRLRLDRMMSKWVVDHILNDDRKYFSFVKHYQV